MNKNLIFLDCDPGVDDAVAILLLLADPTVELVGVSAVGGNVKLEHTLRNALDLVAVAGWSDIPVYSGAPEAMMGPTIDASHFHGANGLGSVVLPTSPAQPKAEMAWDAIHREAKTHPGELVLLGTGPCTNIAIALTKWADLAGLLKGIVLMGGASAYGNHTPAAEFNFLADPEAAEAVFQSGAKVAVCPLDMTHKAYLTPEELDVILAQGTPQAKLVYDLMTPSLGFCKDSYGVPGAIMHDPAAAIFTLYPDLFTTKECWCGVETGGVHSRGKLVTDAFADASLPNNSTICYDVDRPAFAHKVIELLKRYSA